MTVTDGMDTARARVVAGQLKQQGIALADLGARGGAMADTLFALWSGSDADEFSREWRSAQPFIARSSSDLISIADELTGQADEQDDASEGAGGVRGAGHGAAGVRTELPPHGLETGAPVLPPMVPGMRAKDPEKMWTELKDVWDAWTNPIVQVLKTAYDETLGKVLDKATELGGKFKVLGTVGKVLGVVGGLFSVGFGFVGMVSAVRRLFTEGLSVDVGLQFVEGWLGWAAGGLAIAAAFASGTVVGLPVAGVLGGAALLCGLASIAVGEAREYWPWFRQTVEEDPAWAARVSQHGGLHHGWELPERNAPVPPVYRKSDLAGFMGVPVGA